MTQKSDATLCQERDADREQKTSVENVAVGDKSVKGTAIQFRSSGKSAPVTPQFDRKPYVRQGGCVYLMLPDGRQRAIGTVVTHGDVSTFVSRRRWSHILRQPVRSWAVAEDLVAWLQASNTAWIRVEVLGGRGGPIGFSAPLTWLLEPPSFAVHHPPHDRQRALGLSEWLFDTPASIARDDDMALFGRSVGGRPA